MRIKKTYHFYAAHRNELLTEDKCSRLHGHQYSLAVDIQVNKPDAETGVTILFAEIDRRIKFILDTYFDHKTLVHDQDMLLMVLPEDWRCQLPFPSSAEYLTFAFYAIFETNCKLPVAGLELRETNSAVVSMHPGEYEDWQRFLGRNTVHALLKLFPCTVL